MLYILLVSKLYVNVYVYPSLVMHDYTRVGWYTGIIVLASILATTVRYVEILFSYGIKK